MTITPERLPPNGAAAPAPVLAAALRASIGGGRTGAFAPAPIPCPHSATCRARRCHDDPAAARCRREHDGD